MRRLFAVLAAFLVLGIGSCESMPSSDFLDQIQQAAIRKCGFLPTVKVLVALLNAHPSWNNAVDIADRICTAVGPQPIGPRTGMPPMIEAVPINGIYVQSRGSN